VLDPSANPDLVAVIVTVAELSAAKPVTVATPASLIATKPLLVAVPDHVKLES
jgi:hypothetical protein